MKKIVIVLCVIALLTTMGITVIAAQTSQNNDEISNINENDNATSRVLNKTPDLKYKDNLDLSSDQVYDIDKKIKEDKITEKKGILKEKKLITYGQYLKLMNLEDQKLSNVSENRKIWMTKIEYSQGYDHPKLGHLDNATITAIYDSETGEYLGSELETKNYKSERP